MQILQETPLAPDFSMNALADYSSGQSGSDLREMCRNAAMVPVREFVRKTGGDKGLLELGQLEVRFSYSRSLLSHPELTPVSVGLPPPAPYARRLLPAEPERCGDDVAVHARTRVAAAIRGGQVTAGRDGLVASHDLSCLAVR
jgi:SpoVK/Ycf46/Vps4 family AAA+-type ATPase